MEPLIQTKKCSKCGEVKELESGFHKSNRNKDGYYSSCKVCHQQHYKDNKERYRENHRQWAKKNPERTREFKRQWAKKNIEQRKARALEYRKKNREKINERSRNNYKRDKERYQKYRDEHLEETKEYGLKRSVLLEDTIVRYRIRHRSGLENHQITPELIELKREQLLFYRELKNLKQEVRNGIA